MILPPRQKPLQICGGGEGGGGGGGGGRVRTRVLLADCCFTEWKFSMSLMNCDTSSRNCRNSSRPAATSSLYGCRGSAAAEVPTPAAVASAVPVCPCIRDVVAAAVCALEVSDGLQGTCWAM